VIAASIAEPPCLKVSAAMSAHTVESKATAPTKKSSGSPFCKLLRKKTQNLLQNDYISLKQRTRNDLP
jgi:fructose-1-phosphate kinase PfkB-like protein